MIPLEQIAAAAELFDRYNNALDPLSPECRLAKERLDELISGLHAVHAADMAFLDFRYELVKQCREYLRKNR